MNYYVTFGQQSRREPHPTFPKAHPDGWVRIEAESYPEARTCAWDVFDDQFATMYPEDDFKTEYFPKGEIAVFVAQKV